MYEAIVAQTIEQRFCKPQVRGLIPLGGSTGRSSVWPESSVWSRVVARSNRAVLTSGGRPMVGRVVVAHSIVGSIPTRHPRFGMHPARWFKGRTSGFDPGSSGSIPLRASRRGDQQ